MNIGTNPSSNNQSFGQMTSVRYVRVNGEINDNKTVIENVTKSLVKDLKKDNGKNTELRWNAKKIIPDLHPNYPNDEVKFLKSSSLGRNFNIITGQEAWDLKNIWKQGGTSRDYKKQQAGNILRNLFLKPASHISIDASSKVDSKGNTQYIINNIDKSM